MHHTLRGEESWREHHEGDQPNATEDCLGGEYCGGLIEVDVRRQSWKQSCTCECRDVVERSRKRRGRAFLLMTVKSSGWPILGSSLGQSLLISAETGARGISLVIELMAIDYSCWRLLSKSRRFYQNIREVANLQM